VWTTAALSNLGVGFQLRWRVHTQKEGLVGAWRTPTATWTVDTPPPSAGLPFYFFTNELWLPGGTCWFIPTGSQGMYSSLAAYRAALSADTSCPNRNQAYFYYGVQLEVRYVLTKPANLVYDQLNPISGSFSTQFITFQSRPNAHQVNVAHVSQNITYVLPPLKTCETPTMAEATVNFGSAYPDSFPNAPGGVAAQKDFTFTLRNCPRVNIRYYVHSNNKWVNPSQGIVGLSNSTPHADPVIGNPRGFGIRLQHRTGGHQHSGTIHVHQNQTNAPVQTYTRTYPGAGAVNSNTGVTHTIPLRAQLVRTAPSGQPIQPGPFTAALVFVISYP